MKKALALLLLAGLAFAPVASFATVVDEGLGQGTGFAAALNTGSYDLMFLFPQQSANFANAAYFRLGTPDFDTNPGSTNSFYDGNGLLFGSDDWYGVVDNKHGIGTWGVFTHVPVNYFTDDAGGNNDLELFTLTDGWNNTYTAVGGPEPFNEPGWGATTNDWRAVLNHWADWNGTGNSGFYGGGNSGPSQGIGNAYLLYYIQTPVNKVVVNFADSGFGLSFNYGDMAGDYWDITGTTGSGPATPGAGAYLGYKSYADQSSEYGLSVGYGTKDVGPFGNVDASLSLEIANINMLDSENEENASASGVNNYYIDQVKDNGSYDARLNVLATKDMDDSTQFRTSLTGVLSQLAAEETLQHDTNNDGNFTDDGAANNTKEDAAYANLDVNLNAGCVHKIEGGKGRMVASLGFRYRDQHFTDKGWEWNAGNNQMQYTYYADSEYTNIYVPVRVGAEQDLNDWLTVRLGCSTNALSAWWDKTIGRSNQDAQGNYQNTNTVNSYGDSFETVLVDSGFSVKVGNFTFDALLNQNFFENTFLQNVQPGRGVLFNGDMATLAKAEGTFKF